MKPPGRARLRRALESLRRDKYQGSTESRPTKSRPTKSRPTKSRPTKSRPTKRNWFMVPMRARIGVEAPHEPSRGQSDSSPRPSPRPRRRGRSLRPVDGSWWQRARPFSKHAELVRAPSTAQNSQIFRPQQQNRSSVRFSFLYLTEFSLFRFPSYLPQYVFSLL